MRTKMRVAVEILLQQWMAPVDQSCMLKCIQEERHEMVMLNRRPLLRCCCCLVLDLNNTSTFNGHTGRKF